MAKRTWNAYRYDATWWRLVNNWGSVYWVRSNDAGWAIYTGATRRPVSPKVSASLMARFSAAIEKAAQ